MPRPHKYQRLDCVLETGKDLETVALGHAVMYGVKKGTNWVTVCKEDTFGITGVPPSNQRKYTRLFYATRKPAQSQANRLNRIFNTDQYVVAEI